MYLLPGNPFSQAVEAYRDSGVKRDVQTTRTTCMTTCRDLPTPFTAGQVRRSRLGICIYIYTLQYTYVVLYTCTLFESV